MEAYATFGDRSDVHVARKGPSLPLDCVDCRLPQPAGALAAGCTASGMLAHLEEHQKAGQRVPKRVIQLLIQEVLDQWKIAANLVASTW